MAVTIHVRIKEPDGRWVYRQPVYTKNKKIRAGYAIVGNKPEPHPEAVFAIRYTEHGQRKWKTVGPVPEDAIEARRNREHVERGREIGQPVAGDILPAKRLGHTIESAVERYLELTALRKKRNTLRAYTGALTFFKQEVLPCVNLQALEREDVDRYILAILRSGDEPRTVANRMGYVQTFLNVHGLGHLLTNADKPKYTERNPDAYDREFLTLLFAACTEDDRMAFQFFLNSGCREREVMHACWSDLNFERGTHSVEEKKDFDFSPKNYEERTVPLTSTAFIAELKARRKQRQKDRLIFPTAAGKPEGHFLRRLKQVAFQAGLNCGHCVMKKGECCKDEPVCKKVTLHKFRRTYATLHHEAGVSFNTLMAWLGHKNIETTMLYLARKDDVSPEVRERSNLAFSLAS